jgi:uroporphyrinogen III methyltransferase/synthase
MGAANGSERGVDLPLSGRSIVVTRSADQASALTAPLEALGAEVFALPVIAIADPEDWAPADAAIERVEDYEWIVLTSANGVERLDARMRLHGLRLGDLREARVAVVGSATADRLREFGLEPAVVPERFRAEGLVAAMTEAGLHAGARVLLARAAEAREVLPDRLRAFGAVVDVVAVYRLVTAVPPAVVLDRVAAGGVDAIVFASGGTARRFVEVLRSAGLDPVRVLARTVVVSIGPVTTEALRGLGIRVDTEAGSATSRSVVMALAIHFAGGFR